MSKIEKVTVGNTVYHVVQAPATKQKKLMLLLGSRIALNTLAGGRKSVDQGALVGTLTTLKEEEFDQVVDIVLSQVVPAGGDTPVTLDDFQGSMGTFFQLVAGAVAANLDDFFTWLGSDAADPAVNQ